MFPLALYKNICNILLSAASSSGMIDDKSSRLWFRPGDTQSGSLTTEYLQWRMTIEVCLDDSQGRNAATNSTSRNRFSRLLMASKKSAQASRKSAQITN